MSMLVYGVYASLNNLGQSIISNSNAISANICGCLKTGVLYESGTTDGGIGGINNTHTHTHTLKPLGCV